MAKYAMKLDEVLYILKNPKNTTPFEIAKRMAGRDSRDGTWWGHDTEIGTDKEIIEPIIEALDKARQQGIEIGIGKAQKEWEIFVNKRSIEAYEQGASAERKRIFTLHDKNMDKFIIELRKFRK